MLLISPKSGAMHARPPPPTTIEKLVCRSLQYAKLDSLFQNSPYSNLPNKSDWSPVPLAVS